MADAPLLRITVVYSGAARSVVEKTVVLHGGCTLQAAVQASGLLQEHPELGLDTLDVGVWGKVAGLEYVLQDQDRVEIYRPLTVDPKVARRTRFKGQGARTTGLFAQKRQGAKAGYGG